MPKEHAGGVGHDGIFRVPTEWAEGQATAVKVENFDFDCLDSLDDRIQEELKTKGSAAALFRRLVSLEVDKVRSDIAVFLLSEIFSGQDEYRSLIELAFASGMLLTAKKSGSEYARMLGISKQALQQGVKERAQKLNMRKRATMRDLESRDLMRLANFRPKERRDDAGA